MLYAVAYLDAVDDGGGYDPAVDTAYAFIDDTDGSGDFVSVGDEFTILSWPTNFAGGVTPLAPQTFPVVNVTAATSIIAFVTIPATGAGPGTDLSDIVDFAPTVFEQLDVRENPAGTDIVFNIAGGGFSNPDRITGHPANTLGIPVSTQSTSAVVDSPFLDIEIGMGSLPSVLDFGDAQEFYATTLAEDGARHTATGLTLGTERDTEANGTHSAGADFDDNDAAPDDEDGVTFGTIQVGTLDATVTVNVQGAAGKLDAWIDFNGDGSWGGPGEQIFDNFAVGTGDNVLMYDVPSWAEAGTTYARFRLSSAGDLGVTGLAADGEVEDYEVTISSPAIVSNTFATQNISTSADGAKSVFAVDVDDDGDVDVLSASNSDDTIAWYENDGDENFTEHVITAAASGAFSVFAADVDGDGDTDVLSASNTDDTIAWYENDGSENFSTNIISTTADAARSVFAADMDGDGDTDVLSASFNDATIAWYENNGSENFTKRVISNGATFAESVFAADIDGDGDLDVASASGSNIHWYQNDGNQNFTTHIVGAANRGYSVFVADVDGDGNTDVLSASRDNNTFNWFENDGSQNFTTHVISNTANAALSVFAADVDGDGDTDVLGASADDDTIAWYENDGNENFTKRTISAVADGAQSVFVADVDSDGDTDVLSASIFDDKIAWYEQQFPSLSLSIVSNDLVLTEVGNDTSDDLTISTDGTNIVISANNLLDDGGIANVTGHNTNTLTIPLTEFSGGIIVDSLGGDDSLTVDFGGGANFTRTITFNGGTQDSSANGDTLALTGGGTFADAAFTYINSSDGSVDVTGNATINYNGLEPISSTITATNVTLNYSAAAEGITVADAPAAGQTIVQSTAGENTTFNNPTGELAINTGGGADVVMVLGLDSAWTADLTVNGDTDDIVNLGGSIGVVDSAGSVGSYTSVAVVDNNPAISYYDQSNGDLKFARNSAADGSGTWTTVSVDTAGTVGRETSLAVVDGNPAISYLDESNTNLKFARNSAADGSGIWTTVTVDSAAAVGGYTSMAIVDDNPAISYHDYGNGDLKFARNSAADGSGTWTTVSVDTAGIVGAYTSLAIVDGNPAISYYDQNNGALKFARNSAADGSGTWTTVTVDTAGLVGLFTSLAVVDGNPAISYHDFDNGDLKFARNSAADGSGTWTTVSIDTAGTVGWFTSLAIWNGKPAISYFAASGNDLKFAHNSAADGSGTWTIVDVETASSVGFYSSLAIVDGNPVISYQDISNADLKFARVGGDLDTGGGNLSITASAVNLFRGVTVGAGDLTLTSDAVDVMATLSGNGNLTIEPRTDSQSIGVGDGSGDLNLDAAELAFLADGFSSVTIGDTVAGTGSVDISVPGFAFTDPITFAGGTTTVTNLVSSGPSIALASTSSVTENPGDVIPDTVETGDVGRYTSLAVVDGNPAISYYDDDNRDLKFARNRAADGTGIWTTLSVDTAGNVGTDTSLAIVDGNPAISYHDVDNSDLKFARNSAADGSGTWTTVSVDPASDVGSFQFSSLAIVDGNPAISFHDDNSGDLKFTRNSAADGSGTWTTVSVDGTGDVGSHSSLAIVDGNPAISYYDDDNGYLKFARNSAADGSGTWTTVSVDTTDDVGWFTSLAIVDGNPGISYYDRDNGILKFARNSAADGSGTWTTVSVDTDDSVGWYSSLAIVDGKPAISYHDDDNGDLRFASNSAADGSGTWTIVTVDAEEFVGEYASMAIVDGSAAISYYNDNGDLKFARLVPSASITSNGGNVTITAVDDINVNGAIDADNGTPGNVDLTSTSGNITGTPNGFSVTATTATIDGNLVPGSSPGIFNVTGNTQLADNSTFSVELGGTTAGTGAGFHDQLAATGSVTIGTGVTLNMSAFDAGGGSDFVPSVGETFTIINRTGGTGTFDGLAESAIISTDFLGSGFGAIVTYTGGNGDDVELIAVVLPDFGDAPFPYPVTLTEDGARHLLVGLTLGSERDGEANGTHSAGADFDDNDAAPDDEDGVTFGTIQVGALDALVTVNVQGAAGKLDAWIDFNGDGSWGGPGEQIFDNVTVNVGDNILMFDVPSWANAGDTYARFRLSTAGDLGVRGAAVDGEVEDYQVTINSPAPGASVFAVQNIVSTGVDLPFGVFTADVDGDGDMDVLSASAFDAKIAWHENDGNENFTTHTISVDAPGARSVMAADVDGDGDIDAISASLNNNKIAWYENDGNENFTAHTITTSANGAHGVFAADIDGDGDTDILSASQNDDKIAWYENDGNENFTPHTITTAADGARNVYAADVDGDGDTDVLSASPNDNKIAWYENDGNENFTAHNITTSANAAFDVIATDLDGDGDTDVLSASSNDDKIAWYENDGNENFTAHTITLMADGAVRVRTVDLDGDGDTDVLSASLSDNKFAWYENDGSENFTAHTITTATNGAISFQPADVDGDGDIDVVGASLLGNEIIWYENLVLDFGDAPDSYLTLSASGGPRHGIDTNLLLGAFIDPDSDGFGDGVEDNPGTATDDNTEGFVPNDEDGVVQFPVLNVASSTYSVTVSLVNTTGGSANLIGWIDFDGNGTFDADEASSVVVADAATSALLTWNDIGGSGPDVVAGSTFARLRLATDAITATDIGGVASDGEVEDYAFVITKHKIGVYRPSSATFYLDSNGNGLFDFGTDDIHNFGSVGDVPIVGDWNNDGIDEIGAFNPSTATFYLDTNGNGQFDLGPDTVIGFGAVNDIPVIGDWNNDAIDDIGIYRPSTSTFFLDSNGNGLFDIGTDAIISFGAIGDVPIVGDWNNDGFDDIGIYRPSTATFYLDSNGNGLFDLGSDTVIGFGGLFDVPIIADWNDDGIDDIGVYRPSTVTFIPDSNGNGQYDPITDHVIAFGAVGDIPVVGNWKNPALPKPAAKAAPSPAPPGDDGPAEFVSRPSIELPVFAGMSSEQLEALNDSALAVARGGQALEKTPSIEQPILSLIDQSNGGWLLDLIRDEQESLNLLGPELLSLASRLAAGHTDLLADEIEGIGRILNNGANDV